jgi:hypothetical protein
VALSTGKTAIEISFQRQYARLIKVEKSDFRFKVSAKNNVKDFLGVIAVKWLQIGQLVELPLYSPSRSTNLYDQYEHQTNVPPTTATKVM